jgi:lipoyl(octanoyl) transferase
MQVLEFEYAGFGPDAVDYQTAWDRQRALHAARLASGQDDGTDIVMLLEHAPVYTAGKRTASHERPVDGTPVIDVDRGGKITFHGPGQLVGYPIVRLPKHVYVVDYVRLLEEALIRTCAALGLESGRVSGRSGVWLPADDHRMERKIAALGVRVSRSVTMHGFALNCNCDLAWFDRIVPCGIPDAGVTSLSAELNRDVTVLEVLPYVEHHLRDLLSWRPYERSADVVRAPELASRQRRVVT